MKRRGPWRQALRLAADRYLADAACCRQNGDAARESANPKSRRYMDAAAWYACAEQLESLARDAMREIEGEVEG